MRDGGLHFGRDLGIRELRRQVRAQHRDFRLLLLDEIGAPGGLELADRILALLDHLVDHRGDARVVERHALVDLALLDRGEQQADRREPLAFLRAHRGLHVFTDLVSQTHRISGIKISMRRRLAASTQKPA
ncbi:hypothetical protein Y025_5577 [Burkholderia pseudomallei TSV32]|nr:hypothetical protein Y025_5577 [Burkholderia pseudomallei TSV32]